jgi:hypothetical protein
MSFANLKRQSLGNLSKITQAVEALSKPAYSNNKDDFWLAELDKAGNGSAVIRFLPTPAVDEKTNPDAALPWAKVFQHAFKGPSGKWMIDTCPTTLGNGTECPVCDNNSVLWNSGLESDKEFVRKNTKRKVHYISNIYIVNDPKHPENNGTVRLFKYNESIFQKLMDAIKPKFEDEAPFDPFDLFTGADFKLRIYKDGEYSNFDKCEFASCGPVLDDEAEMEKVYNQEQSILKYLDPANIKSYDELKTRMEKTLGLNGDGTKAKRTTVETLKEAAETAKVSGKRPQTPASERTLPADDDDDMDYFRKLAD